MKTDEMEKQYTTNENKQRELYARVRRESKLWKNTLWLRILVFVCIPTMFFILNIFLDLGTSLIITIAFGCMAAVQTFAILRILPTKSIWKYDDRVFIVHAVIVNIFIKHSENIITQSEYDAGYQQKIEINIKDIRKIILNKEQGYVAIYAPMKYTEYKKHQQGIIECERNISGEDSYRVFYEYIEEFDDFINTIVEVSGVEPTIDNSDKILLEKSLKSKEK